MELCPGIQILFNVEGELFIIIGCVLVVRVLRQIVFIGQEGTNASQLQDAFAAVHDCQFIPAHKLFAIMSSDEFKKGKKSSPLFEEGLNVTINCWVLSASHSFV